VPLPQDSTKSGNVLKDPDPESFPGERTRDGHHRGLKSALHKNIQMDYEFIFGLPDRSLLKCHSLAFSYLLGIIFLKQPINYFSAICQVCAGQTIIVAEQKPLNYRNHALS